VLWDARDGDGVCLPCIDDNCDSNAKLVLLEAPKMLLGFLIR